MSFDTFECPDVYPIASQTRGVDTVVFEASMCSDTCEPPYCPPKPGAKQPYPVGTWNNHGEEFWVGTIDPKTKVLRPTSHSVVDYGAYYASKTAAGLNQTGRRVLFGYIEASVNRQGNGADRWTGSCGGKLVESEALPREVTTRAAPDGTTTVAFEPVRELEALRVASSELVKEGVALQCGDNVAIGDLGHSFEVRAAFSASVAGVKPDGATFGVSVLAGAHPPQQHEVTLIGLGEKRFFVDKTKSTLRNSTPPVFLDVMTVPLDVTAENMTLFVDGRVVEIFVAGKALSTLVYPSSNASTKLGLFMRCPAGDPTGDPTPRGTHGPVRGAAGVVTASVRAWMLRPIKVTKPTPAASLKADDERPVVAGARRSMPPGFSWETLPVHWFSANATSQLSPEAAARIAARHSLVIFNGQSHAYQAAPYGKHAEAKMVAGGELVRAAADRLGIRRPSLLAYFNSVVGWTAYDFQSWMAQNQTRMLHDADGRLHFCRKDGLGNTLFIPDLSLPEVRAKWVEVVAQTGNAMDGVFVDRGDLPGSPGAKTDKIAPAKLEAWKDGHVELVHELRQAMPDKLFLLNDHTLALRPRNGSFPPGLDHE
eukprot:SAG22_NODE_1379_length_4547_cov_8.497752_5_plen_596_part_00